MTPETDEDGFVDYSDDPWQAARDRVLPPIVQHAPPPPELQDLKPTGRADDKTWARAILANPGQNNQGHKRPRIAAEMALRALNKGEAP